MPMPRVSGLYVYPVKSARGIAVTDWHVTRMGLNFDRQWMVVDERGMLGAQRQEGGMGVGIKNMSLVHTSLENLILTCTAPVMEPLRIPVVGVEGEVVTTQVWATECMGIDQGLEAAEWFTEFLSRERPGNYRLVRMPDYPREGFRKAKRGDAHIGYADADTALIIGQPSLDDLNQHIGGEVLPMNRFRPNIVVSGCEPYAEDKWGEIRIGNVIFIGTKECVRCPITTQNQDTTERGKEPLATLATYRRVQGEGAVFGMNFVHHISGVVQPIRIGDAVEVLGERKSFL